MMTFLVDWQRVVGMFWLNDGMKGVRMWQAVQDVGGSMAQVHHLIKGEFMSTDAESPPSRMPLVYSSPPFLLRRPVLTRN